MKKWNYYNDNDPKACAWAKELIKAGFAPDGEVDCRSIADVRADDVRGFIQCHFFCGILGWSYALRLAGWPDDKPIWTGSCPCQPFSAAGAGQVDKDERHLWPAFRGLIAECRPAIVFGEQVASKDGRIWIAGVRSDLEALGYGVGAADLCAAGVGAPHPRHRLFWGARRVANPEHSERWTKHSACGDEGGNGLSQRQEGSGGSGSDCEVGRVADMQRAGLEERPEQPARQECETAQRSSDAVGVGDPDCQRLVEHRERDGEQDSGIETSCRADVSGSSLWDRYEIIPCGPGKARRIESGTFPLANGVPYRVAKLRGLGNAIVPQVAAEFIQAFLEAEA